MTKQIDDPSIDYNLNDSVPIAIYFVCQIYAIFFFYMFMRQQNLEQYVLWMFIVFQKVHPFE